jgi:hypothetical protein
MRLFVPSVLVSCLLLTGGGAFAEPTPGPRPVPQPRPPIPVPSAPPSVAPSRSRPEAPVADPPPPAPERPDPAAPLKPDLAEQVKPHTAAAGPVHCGTPAWRPFRNAVESWCANKKKDKWCPSVTRLYRDCSLKTSDGAMVLASTLPAVGVAKGKVTDDIAIQRRVNVLVTFAKVRDVWKVKKLAPSLRQ